jgi:hypothetical protein
MCRQEKLASEDICLTFTPLFRAVALNALDAERHAHLASLRVNVINGTARVSSVLLPFVRIFMRDKKHSKTRIKISIVVDHTGDAIKHCLAAVQQRVSLWHLDPLDTGYLLSCR